MTRNNTQREEEEDYSKLLLESVIVTVAKAVYSP